MATTDGSAHVYLSPHLDDVVLSCGGRIWQQVQTGERVLVVTVFARAPEPDPCLSSYARGLHARWGQSADAVKKRQEEDLQALSLLGAESLHWPYMDCIYRCMPGGAFLYASEEALWDHIHPSETGLVQELVDRIRALPLLTGDTLYTPLGAGGHVDHRILRQAVEGSGYALIAYEDFPYAQVQQAVERALANGRWESELVILSERALDAKIAAITCYRSQVSTFWGSTADMAAAVRAFAQRTGNGRLAERYWKPRRP
jgi:LmbE family N-acetylglucosaminyl deacetylase